MRRLIAIFLVSALSGLANAQPVPVAVPQLGGNGHAETWDGRVFVVTRGYQGRIGWVVRTLRPEALTANGQGVPQFTGQVFSDWEPLEFNGDPGGLTDHNALAVVPAPGFSENPFASDASGAPLASGAFETYELIVYTQRYAPSDDRMGQRRARIVVENPRTPDAKVRRAVFLSDFEALDAGGAPLRGIEPTATFDGHLLMWQGHPDNDGKIDVLVYSFNQSRGARGGWSQPRSISDMHHRDRDTVVAGIAFHERYPIAKEPLRAADGNPFRRGELYRGAYPWISLDGTELFHTALVAGIPNVNRARRGGLSVIGRWTGFRLRHIDGPLNPNRNAQGSPGDVRLFFSSPGASPGFWAPYADVKDVPLPYTAARPVFPLFGSNTSNYGEVSFEDHEDGDTLLSLPMNELITKGADVDATRTPDISGGGRNGALEGARFPQEYSGHDGNVGAVGQGIYFGDRDRVRVRADVLGGNDALTAELWVRRLVDLDQDAQNRYRLLLNQPGAWNLILEESGAVQATVVSSGQQRRSGGVGPALALDRWVHVAMTYTPSDGRLAVFLDGSLASETRFGAGGIDGASGDLIVGPGNQTPAAPFVAAGQAVVLLDEVKVSRVARSESELARSAFRPLPAPSFGGQLPVPLPLGLDAADLRIPAGQISAAQVELGKLLFFDPRLSSTGQISCATCHDPRRAFSDGLPTGRGVSGTPLLRNSQATVNRAFSSLQFWDGRASSLEAQASAPLEHPDEMNMPTADAVDLLRRMPGYVQRFQAAFGGRPNVSRLRAALASYQRTLLSGDSPVDRFEAGRPAALTPTERRGRLLFRGKGRCTACHTGSNYSDESFHVDGFFNDLYADPGRKSVTGRARDLGRFKTPSLRDVSRTAPYLHDGSVATLADVIELYDRGGVNHLNRDPEIRPLGLSAAEKADLLAFLKALDGTTLDTSVPPRLPDGPNGAPPPPPGGVVVSPPPPAPPPPAPPPPAIAANEKFVRALYRDLLGRNADPIGLNGYVNGLGSGMTRGDVVRSFLASGEYLRKHVKEEYRRFLRRSPAGSARNAIVADLQAGTQTTKGLAAQLTSSAEYRQKHPPRDLWVRQLYLDVLRRQGEPAGVTSHVAGLQASGDDYRREAFSFLDSSEHHHKHTQAAYLDFLSRPPTAQERDAERARLDAGDDLVETIHRVVSSQEYFDRQQ